MDAAGIGANIYQGYSQLKALQAARDAARVVPPGASGFGPTPPTLDGGGGGGVMTPEELSADEMGRAFLPTEFAEEGLSSTSGSQLMAAGRTGGLSDLSTLRQGGIDSGELSARLAAYGRVPTSVIRGPVAEQPGILDRMANRLTSRWGQYQARNAQERAINQAAQQNAERANRLRGLRGEGGEGGTGSRPVVQAQRMGTEEGNANQARAMTQGRARLRQLRAEPEGSQMETIQSDRSMATAQSERSMATAQSERTAPTMERAAFRQTMGTNSMPGNALSSGNYMDTAPLNNQPLGGYESMGQEMSTVEAVGGDFTSAGVTGGYAAAEGTAAAAASAGELTEIAAFAAL